MAAGERQHGRTRGSCQPAASAGAGTGLGAVLRRGGPVLGNAMAGKQPSPATPTLVTGLAGRAQCHGRCAAAVQRGGPPPALRQSPRLGHRVTASVGHIAAAFRAGPHGGGSGAECQPSVIFAAVHAVQHLGPPAPTGIGPAVWPGLPRALCGTELGAGCACVAKHGPIPGARRLCADLGFVGAAVAQVLRPHGAARHPAKDTSGIGTKTT